MLYLMRVHVLGYQSPTNSFEILSMLMYSYCIFFLVFIQAIISFFCLYLANDSSVLLVVSWLSAGSIHLAPVPAREVLSTHLYQLWLWPHSNKSWLDPVHRPVGFSSIGSCLVVQYSLFPLLTLVELHLSDHPCLLSLHVYVYLVNKQENGCMVVYLTGIQYSNVQLQVYIKSRLYFLFRTVFFFFNYFFAVVTYIEQQVEFQVLELTKWHEYLQLH